ncbi:Glycosyltransferase involved in cell wall bisynthesis [Enhydrobacter aerosaccus]|uniref:Glycosyltransferase involved in cell wall bisynthesis n=1 Tax=Enhydrobacter aerosaccus TaxID=225324 RepID=A0A1T4RGN0_9HYPH|nr:glycosyltransferase family 2 protein [Enhydrobacter aerosaccus]SKA15103.1 Glycosyltransferase involved in cell wall bisynthesis [Enhydrobacter aerosaccus]
MEFIDNVTPLLITYNEIENIERTLAPLGWAHRIVVVDSGSTDGTLDILKKDSRIEVYYRPFDSFAEQCNFGLSKITSEWVLSLDADYELSEPLVAELQTLWPSDAHGGFRARFTYRIYGRSLRGSLYPPRVVLYRVSRGHYENEGHGHRVRISGEVSDLRAPIYHDDRKPLTRWLGSQLKYAQREAVHLIESPSDRLTMVEKIRRMGWPAPILVFFYVLIAKGAILDGIAGWFYAFQRLFAEVLLALELLDRRLSRAPAKKAGAG